MTVTARQILDRSMSEEQLQDAVIEYLDLFGWTWAHIPDRLYKLAVKERRFDAMPGAKGFLDILALHPDGRLIVIECKTEQGDLEPEQDEWLRLWGAFMARIWGVIPARKHAEMLDLLAVVIWRPSDLSDGTVEAFLTGAAP